MSMAPHSDQFIYEPLEQPLSFRLLTLWPGERDETLKCSLFHSSLASKPEYRALSYTWGLPGNLNEIELNGISHPIQANLFDFLQELRSTYRGIALILWVDALCINQDDISEKSVQIPLMGMIYSTAYAVLVWLGPAADESERYFDFCAQIHYESQDQRPAFKKDVNSENMESLSASTIALQSRNYWTRAWITQEIVLASDIFIFCGDRFTHWVPFTFTMLELDNRNLVIDGRDSSHPFGRLRKLRVNVTSLTLRQLLFQCHTSKCFDPRDLIFSLLNIAKRAPDDRNRLESNYSWSLEKLFLWAMYQCPHDERKDIGNSSLQLCDTLATRLGIDLQDALREATEILQTAPASHLAEGLTRCIYYAKLTRFGRLSFKSAGATEDSSQSTAVSHSNVQSEEPLRQYTVRKGPGTVSLHQMWTFDTAEATDKVFLLDFESPNQPSQHLACICRLIDEELNEESLLFYRVVGLGLVPSELDRIGAEKAELDMQVVNTFLRDSSMFPLDSLHGRVVQDSVAGYHFAINLLELTRLCLLARASGSFLPWSMDNTTAAQHWQWKNSIGDGV